MYPFTLQATFQEALCHISHKEFPNLLLPCVNILMHSLLFGFSMFSAFRLLSYVTFTFRCISLCWYIQFPMPPLSSSHYLASLAALGRRLEEQWVPTTRFQCKADRIVGNAAKVISFLYRSRSQSDGEPGSKNLDYFRVTASSKLHLQICTSTPRYKQTRARVKNSIQQFNQKSKLLFV